MFLDLIRSKNQIIRLAWMLCIMLICTSSSSAQTAVTPEIGYQFAFRYTYTGANQTFTVPAGVTSIRVKAWGGGGGVDGIANTAYVDGGTGGYTYGTLPVVAGQTYIIVVGSRGITTTGSYLGGGSGGTGSFFDGSGGGLSGIFLSSISQANARLIAGGGGGGAMVNASTICWGGNGNGPTSGGNTALQGITETTAVNGTAGGGGGYVGGIRHSRSGNTAQGGEGGSGFVHSSVTNSGMLFTADNNNKPAPGSTDVHYVAGVGRGTGFLSVNPDIVDTLDHGMVVIQYSFDPENCTDGIDNDGDGFIDGADPDCISNHNFCTTPTYSGTAWQTMTPESGFNTAVAIKYTGRDQTFTVPAGLTSIKVKAWGAGGGGNVNGATNHIGGSGAYTTCVIPVVSGETYKLVVGQGGVRGSNSAASLVPTYGGGGAGGSAGTISIGYGASGGGLSGLFKTSITPSNTMMIAAGGGGISASPGGSSCGTLGNGGALTGDNGCQIASSASAGIGATVSAAGAGGSLLNVGTAGSQFQGGAGGVGQDLANPTSPASGASGGGGGGGGYFGGGGGTGQRSSNGTIVSGGGQDAGGGGGSSFFNALVTSTSATKGANATAPNNTDIHYISGLCRGGTGAQDGGNGLIVIQYNRVTTTNTTNTDTICETSTKALIGSPAGGTWSIVSGGGSISGSTYTPADISTGTSVTVRYTSGGCTADRTFMVTPVATISNTTSTTAICESGTKALTASPSGGTWSVVSGGGSISGTTYIPANIAADSTVVIRYTLPAASGCAAVSSNVSFTVNYQPSTAINTTSTDSICETSTKALTGSPAGGTWSIVSGGGSISGTTYTPADVLADSTITVRYAIAANGQCPGTGSDISFVVVPTITVANTTSTTSVCESGTKSLSGTPSGGTWSIVSGGGSISGTTYTPADVTANTTATVRYTVAGRGGCAAVSADASFTVNVDNGAANNMTTTASICENQTKSLSASPTGGSFSILSGGGSISGSTYTPADVTSPTQVTIRYTAAANGGCAATTSDSTFTVNEIPTPSGVSSTNPTGCGSTNGSITIAGLAASTSYTVSYTGPSGFSSASYTTNASGSIVLSSLAAGVYSNSIVSKGGCASATLSPVTLSNPASPTISSSSAVQPTVCNGTGSILLNGLAASTTYAVNYTSSAAGMVSVNLATNTAGVLTIPNLASATYSSIYVVLSGCASNSVGPYTLVGPAPTGTPSINCK